MKRVYITAMSLQGPNMLETVLYEPQGFVLKKNRECGFPIIPIIEETREEGDEILITVLRFVGNRDAKDNFAVFCKEIEKMGLDPEECIEEVLVPEPKQQGENKQDEKYRTNVYDYVYAMMNLLDKIPNHSEIYACLTYGTKPTPIIMLFAMQLVQRLMSNVEICGLFYGEVERKRVEIDGKVKSIPDRAFLHDITPLLHVKELVEQLSLMHISDPKGRVRELLSKREDKQ